VIEIRDKKVYRNGEYVTGPYEIHKDSRILSSALTTRDNFGPVTVPEGCLFMMGDNRDNSQDSRFWGFAKLEKVKGKAMFIYWSWDSDAFGVRWGRLGHWLK
jgi:signal peptidase I